MGKVTIEKGQSQLKTNKKAAAERIPPAAYQTTLSMVFFEMSEYYRTHIWVSVLMTTADLCTI